MFCHLNQSAGKAAAKSAFVVEADKCWTCGKAGHRSPQCPGGGGKGWPYAGKKGGGKSVAKGSAKGGAKTATRGCFTCGDASHLVKDCPRGTKRNADGTNR